jgi:hypothetical protein
MSDDCFVPWPRSTISGDPLPNDQVDNRNLSCWQQVVLLPCPQACEAHGGLLVVDAGGLVAVGDRPCLDVTAIKSLMARTPPRIEALAQTGTQAQADLVVQ